MRVGILYSRIRRDAVEAAERALAAEVDSYG